ncbi:MAG: hypothetical protein RR705_05020 [Lachnospiraceae bacterium]
MDIPTKKKWFSCPNCGQHLLIYDNTASCKNVFVRCKKCGLDIEIKI